MVGAEHVRWWGAAWVALVLLWLWPSAALAQSTIKLPGQRTRYSFELEPHLVLGALDPPGVGFGNGFGVGAHGTIEVAADGFLPKLNDSVGVGFGLDWVEYDTDRRGRCTEFSGGPNGTRICTEVDAGGRATYFLLPVVMQWNFWLTRKWSVFGEPGLFLYLDEDHAGFHPLSISAGGRFHFSEFATLTMRLGYPVVTLGVSFLL